MRGFLESRIPTVVLLIMAAVTACLLLYDTIIVVTGVSCAFYDSSLHIFTKYCIAVFVWGTALLALGHLAPISPETR